MTPTTLRHSLRAFAAAACLAAAATASAQADNSNSATDPTYYDAYYGFNPLPAAPFSRDTEFNVPHEFVYGPSSHARGPAYYEPWRYYDQPPIIVAEPGVTPLGTVTAPGYMGPRDVTP